MNRAISDERDEEAGEPLQSRAPGGRERTLLSILQKNMSAKRPKKRNPPRNPPKAKRVDPNLVRNTLEKAVRHYQAGHLYQAEKQCRRILGMDPGNADACHILGMVFLRKGRRPVALEWVERAVKRQPDVSLYLNSLGNVHHEMGSLDEALRCYQEAVAREPGFVEAWFNAGAVFHSKGWNRRAVDALEKAVALKPDHHMAYNNLAKALQALGIFDRAVTCCEKAIRLQPSQVGPYVNLGGLLRKQGRLDEAVRIALEAVALEPNSSAVHHLLGSLYKDQGRIREAMESYNRASEIQPNHPALQSDVFLSLHYTDSLDSADLFARHKNRGLDLASQCKTKIQIHENDPSPHRCLRIGYVSGDFRKHSVSYFTKPVLEFHDPSAFETFCYSDVTQPDSMTATLRGMAERWRDIRGLPDEQAAALMREDAIDILVDLAGHTAGNRLSVFARKPAPVQVTYLGYPATTGLPEMDYRITDAFADPPGRTDHLHTEELIRLPKTFLCFSRPAKNPPITRCPVEKNGFVTFGSFNNLAKVSSSVLDAWTGVLRSVPGSRLVLKSRALSDPETGRHVLGRFEGRGVDSERITLLGFVPGQFGHLDAYNTIDIALDTFPYHGTTTTCESLWMGVPVIVLSGETHVTRVGVSLLSNIGAKELIAQSSEEYVGKAVQLAGQVDRLKTYRSELRSMMQRSPLMNAADFVRDLETAYRRVWRMWCEGRNSRGDLPS